MGSERVLCDPQYIFFSLCLLIERACDLNWLAAGIPACWFCVLSFCSQFSFCCWALSFARLYGRCASQTILFFPSSGHSFPNHCAVNMADIKSSVVFVQE